MMLGQGQEPVLIRYQAGIHVEVRAGIAESPDQSVPERKATPNGKPREPMVERRLQSPIGAGDTAEQVVIRSNLPIGKQINEPIALELAPRVI